MGAKVEQTRNDGGSYAVFVDTNGFIQLRDLADLPWTEACRGATGVDIYVTPTVIDELDRFKNDRSKRISTRARAALQLLDAAAAAPGMRLSLRERPIPVRLCIATGGAIDWAALPALDPSRADDRLIAEALAEEIPGVRYLLSHDTGPRIRARRVGLDVLPLPSGWLLGEAPDDDAREIARLKRENEALRLQRPQLDLSLRRADRTIKRIKIERLRLDPLPRAVIDAVVERHLAAHPRATPVFTPSGGFGFGVGCQGFSQADADRYHEKYVAFAASLPGELARLHERVGSASETVRVDCRVENTGSATAEGLVLKVEVSDDWLLFADREHADSWSATRLALPSAPPTPHMDAVRRTDRLGMSVLGPGPQAPRVPTDFYWQERPRGIATSCSSRCEEFRAKRVYTDVIWLRPFDKPPLTGRLDVGAHCGNGSGPVAVSAQLQFSERAAAWTDPALAAYLDKDLATLLREAMPA